MNGWEIDDLLGALKATIKEDCSTLKQFCTDYHPLCAMAAGSLVILRQFKVVLWQNERRIMNAQPEHEDNSQWGITVVQHDGSSGSMFSVCIPNSLNYQHIALDDKGHIAITASDHNITTNINELQNKLKRIYGLATEAEIDASFDSLNNESQSEVENPNVVFPMLTDNELGTLTYNHYSGKYETAYLLGENTISVFIELTQPDQLKLLVGEVAKKLAGNYHLQAMRAMLIPMLTLKNDHWLVQDEQGKSELPLTVDEFEERITITAIEFYADGNSVIYCDDGGLFYGHCIMIDLDKDGQFIDANIAG